MNASVDDVKMRWRADGGCEGGVDDDDDAAPFSAGSSHFCNIA